MISRRHLNHLFCAGALLLGTVAASHAAQPAPKVKFSTSAGDFVMEVYPDKAPKTVENFLQYVKDKHYDGTVFHRVIPTFMVQGGGFDASYTQKTTRAPVAHEGRAALAKGATVWSIEPDARRRQLCSGFEQPPATAATSRSSPSAIRRLTSKPCTACARAVAWWSSPDCRQRLPASDLT